MHPSISILMPVRNAEPTLALSLESIRRQRGVSWECVVVDDGSSDGSRVCLERAAQLDARIPPERLTELTTPGASLPIVVSVARAGPRSEVRRALGALGFEELRDFVCAA